MENNLSLCIYLKGGIEKMFHCKRFIQTSADIIIIVYADDRTETISTDMISFMGAWVKGE